MTDELSYEQRVEIQRSIDRYLARQQRWSENPSGATEREHACPNCGEWYAPEYPTWEEAPEGSIGREQHQSGVCSEECWDEFVGAL